MKIYRKEFYILKEEELKKRNLRQSSISQQLKVEGFMTFSQTHEKAFVYPFKASTIDFLKKGKVDKNN